jgi:hypothetical protein
MNNLGKPHDGSDVVNKAYVDSRAPLSQLEGGLRAYYNFEDYNDIVSGHNGTPQGTSVAITNDAGKINKGLEFGSNSDYLNVGDAWHIGANDFTISFWENPLDNVGGIHCIWNNGDAKPRFGIIHKVHENGEFSMFTQDDTVNTEIKTVSSENSYPTLNQWYHVVFQREGTTGRIYVNGELDTSGEVIGTNLSASGQSTIRRSTGTQSSCYIDEVAAWDRILTSDEIKYLYNDGLATNDFTNYDYTFHYDIDMKQHQILQVGGMESKKFNIDDDSTVGYVPANNFGVLMVTVGKNIAQLFYDLTSPDIKMVSQLDASVSIGSGSATGTTGFDNKFTVFADDVNGQLTFENRLGQSEDVRLLVLL